MRVGHAPDGSSGLVGGGGAWQWWTLPCWLPDSPSCQQRSKARAERGVGLHSLDIPSCGGSWTGAVLLVLDSQGWLGKGRWKLNRNKGGRQEGRGGLGEQANYSGCESVTCVVFQWEYHSVLISPHSNTNRCFNKRWLSKRPKAGGGGGELLSCPFNIYISCLSHLVYAFCITSCEVKARVYVNINSARLCSDVMACMVNRDINPWLLF